MNKHLADLVKAYLPPWWVNEKVTKEEAMFHYTNRDWYVNRWHNGYCHFCRYVWEFEGVKCMLCKSGWVDCPITFEEVIGDYYYEVSDFEPGTPYHSETPW